jgi:hypothetical protein
VRADPGHVTGQPGEHVDVPARGEGPAAPGEHDRAHAVVPPEAGHELAQLAEPQLVHRVELLRPAHRQDGDARLGVGAGEPLHQGASRSYVPGGTPSARSLYFSTR